MRLDVLVPRMDLLSVSDRITEIIVHVFDGLDVTRKEQTPAARVLGSPDQTQEVGVCSEPFTSTSGISMSL